ncbi:syndecan-1 [Discoglossus pictus]
MLRMDKVLVLLYLLGICSLTLANGIKNTPPEDEEADASGDEEDFFSGSGDPFAGVDDAEGDDYPTSVAPLLPVDAPEPTVSQPDSDDEKVEHTTQVLETTKPEEEHIEGMLDPVIFAEGPAVIPTTSEGTTHKPITHQASTAKVTTDYDVDSGKHDHHHHHHHHPHHHNTTTASPSILVDSNVADDTPETTSPSIAHAGKSHVHHVHPKEATTTPSGDGEADIHHVHHEVTTQAKADGSIVHHVNNEQTTTGSGAHDTYDAETVAPSDVDEFVLFEPTTTTPSEEDDSVVQTTSAPSENAEFHVHVDHHEHPNSSEGMDSHIHKLHPLETTTSSHIVDGSDVEQVEATTNSSYNAESGQEPDQQPSTTPVDMNTHHHHHHHHHPHHHNTTAQPSTAPTTGYGVQDEVPIKDNVPESATTSVVVLDEDDSILEESEPTQPPEDKNSVVTDESDVDLTDSKEEEGSGVLNDLFFEPTETNIVPINRKIDLGSDLEETPETDNSDASKSIMDRTEVLGGIIAGGVAGLIFAIALVGFMLYRMKKKDEGSYSLEEPKQSNGGYQKPREQREFYA